MTMPEAAVDEYNRFVLLQHNVRRAGQFTVVDTVAQTTGEKILPHNHFRLGILTLDSRHATATLLRCHCQVKGGNNQLNGSILLS